MRLFLTVLVCLAFAACSRPEFTPTNRTVGVEYDKYLNAVGYASGLKLDDTVYQTLDYNQVGAQPAEYLMAVVPTNRYNAEQLVASGYRGATTHDLFFFAGEYRSDLPENGALCAPHATSRLPIPGSNRIGMPAVARDGRVGILSKKSCRALLFVLESPPAVPNA